MSRFYSMGLIVTKNNLTPREFQVLKEIFYKNWTQDDGYMNEHVAQFYGESHIYGGETEEEIHNRIRDLIKREIKDCSVLTRWTYLEDLPYYEYKD